MLICSNDVAPSRSDSTDYNKNVAAIYSKRKNLDTGFLGYRDLPAILKSFHNTNNQNALDFGCGAGYSTWLLKNAGFDAVGVDASDAMLGEAKANFPDLLFKKLAQQLPFRQGSFSLVLAVFVLLELPTLEAMIRELKKLKSALDIDGKLVIVTTSEHFPKNNWLSAINDTTKNQFLQPGETYRVWDSTNKMMFTDFYYDDQAYRHAFTRAGFVVNDFHQPLGNHSDGIDWTTEWTLPPYSIYVCSAEQ